MICRVVEMQVLDADGFAALSIGIYMAVGHWRYIPHLATTPECRCKKVEVLGNWLEEDRVTEFSVKQPRKGKKRRSE